MIELKSEDIIGVELENDIFLVKIKLSELKYPKTKSDFWLKYTGLLNLFVAIIGGAVSLAKLNGYPDLNPYSPLPNFLMAWFFGHVIVLLLKEGVNSWKT